MAAVLSLQRHYGAILKLGELDVDAVYVPEKDSANQDVKMKRWQSQVAAGSVELDYQSK
jgi:hypothetical protein